MCGLLDAFNFYPDYDIDFDHEIDIARALELARDTSELGIRRRSLREEIRGREGRTSLAAKVLAYESACAHLKTLPTVPQDDAIGTLRAAYDAVEHTGLTLLAGLQGHDLTDEQPRVKEVMAQVEAAEEASQLLVWRVTVAGTTAEERARHRSERDLAMEVRIIEEREAFALWRAETREQLASGTFHQAKVLGQGSFGRAVLLESPTGDRLVGKFATWRGMNEAEKEAAWYEQIGPHPNIARCLGREELSTTWTLWKFTLPDYDTALVMETLEGGDVHEFIEDAQKWMAEGKLRYPDYIGALQYILRGIVEGLRHMHEKGLYHGDLKPLNVMIDTRTGEPKLIDMGFVNDVGLTHATRAYQGRYVMQHGGARTDGVAVGLSAFQGVEGSFQALRRYPGKQEYYEKRAAGQEPSPGLVPWLGAAHQFVNRVTSVDTSLRPSLEEMLELPFLDDPVLDEEDARAVLKRMGALRASSAPA